MVQTAWAIMAATEERLAIGEINFGSYQIFASKDQALAYLATFPERSLRLREVEIHFK